jgi:hypothetical protein
MTGLQNIIFLLGEVLYFGPPEKAATTAGQQRWLIALL